jgi:hypothetical protein
VPLGEGGQPFEYPGRQALGGQVEPLERQLRIFQRRKAVLVELGMAGFDGGGSSRGLPRGMESRGAPGEVMDATGRFGLVGLWGGGHWSGTTGALVLVSFGQS